jgi:hypothetical protein
MCNSLRDSRGRFRVNYLTLGFSLHYLAAEMIGREVGVAERHLVRMA